MQRAWIRDISDALGHAALVQYIDLWRTLHHITLSLPPDCLTWRWTESVVYYVATYYTAMFHGSVEDPN